VRMQLLERAVHYGPVAIERNRGRLDLCLLLAVGAVGKLNILRRSPVMNGGF
jgi:hypothetical protein